MFITAISKKAKLRQSKLYITFISYAMILLSQTLIADATLHFKHGQGDKQKTHNILFIKDHKINLSQSTTAQNANYSIFDAKVEKLTHVNPQRKAYMVMDKATIEQQVVKMKKSIEMMRQQMEERLKSMPADQQKMMRKMMQVQGLGPADQAPPKPKKKHIRSGKTEKILGIKCSIVEVFTDQVKSEELCVAAETQMGLNAEDAETVIAMKQFMNYMAQSARNVMPNQPTEEAFDGLPIRTRSYDSKGKLVNEIILAAFNKDPINSDKVNIPDNFQLVDTPQMH